MTLKLSDIQIRDPYLLTMPDEAAYYLFGTTDLDGSPGTAIGFDRYRSSDLQVWEGPYPAFRPPPGFWADGDFWAPEVHKYRDRFFMFATFKAEGLCRGTQVLVAARPDEAFVPWSDGPVTPRTWECLDGTLHLDSGGAPWIVYCHEWLQVGDATIIAQRLSDDLSRPEGEPITLFHASKAPWVRPVHQMETPLEIPGYVTDGPFLHRLTSGALVMLWSSFGAAGYAMGLSHSTSGEVAGPWVHEAEPLWAEDGGHGMIAKTLDGEPLLSLHQPNQTPLERAVFHRLEETKTSLLLA